MARKKNYLRFEIVNGVAEQYRKGASLREIGLDLDLTDEELSAAFLEAQREGLVTFDPQHLETCLIGNLEFGTAVARALKCGTGSLVSCTAQDDDSVVVRLVRDIPDSGRSEYVRG